MLGLFRQQPDPITLFDAFIASVSYEWDSVSRSSIPFSGMTIEAVTLMQLEANKLRASRVQMYHIRSCAMVVELYQDQLKAALDGLVLSKRTGDRLQNEISCIDIFDKLRLSGMPVKYFGDKRGIVE